MIGPLRPPSAAARAAAFLAVVGVEAEQPLAGNPRRHGADIGADAHVARRTRREPVLFFVLPVVQGVRSWLWNIGRPAARVQGCRCACAQTRAKVWDRRANAAGAAGCSIDRYANSR